MKNVIKQILKEGWGWVDDVKAPFEIGEPLTETNPKNVFRVHLTHAHGEEGGTWSDNWVNFSEEDTDKIVRYLRILNIFMDKRHYYNTIELIIDKALNGNTDYLPNYERFKSDYDEMISNEDRDYLHDFINDELFDDGVYQYDTYYQEPATIERVWMTYFDEYGVEHKVEINYDLL